MNGKFSFSFSVIDHGRWALGEISYSLSVNYANTGLADALEAAIVKRGGMSFTSPEETMDDEAKKLFGEIARLIDRERTMLNTVDM